jgi:hypothetical protein
MRVRRHYRAAVSAECRFICGFSVNPSDTATTGSTECRFQAARNVINERRLTIQSSERPFLGVCFGL